jgi:hypothetical protein
MNEKVGGVFIRKWSGKWITVIADRAGKIQSKKMLSNEEKDDEKTMATVSVYNNVYTRSCSCVQIYWMNSNDWSGKTEEIE